MDPIRILLPKGRLLTGVCDVLSRAHVTFDYVSDRDYKPRVVCETGMMTARVVKPRAIPQLLALEQFDLGFVGYDIVTEADYEPVEILLDLGLNSVELVVAVAKGHEDVLVNPPKRPLVIATEYESLAHRWAMKHGFAHICVQTYGSTEGYAPEIADIVFDCRETGRTIEANGLVVIDRLMKSSTCLVANCKPWTPSKEIAVQQLVHQLQEVLSCE
jgi:ATP phosphoribosyltransferase